MSMQVCDCGSGKRPTGYCNECRMSYCDECKFTHLYTPVPMNISDLVQVSASKAS